MAPATGAIVMEVAALALAAYGTYTQIEAQKAQAAYASKVARMNAEAAAMAAKDIRMRGEDAARLKAEETAQLIGRQKSLYAAGGVDVDSGSPSAVIMDTIALGATDERNIRINAAREAWGVRVQQANFNAEANAIDLASTNATRTLTIQGATNLASMSYQFWGAPGTGAKNPLTTKTTMPVGFTPSGRVGYR